MFPENEIISFPFTLANIKGFSMWQRRITLQKEWKFVSNARKRGFLAIIEEEMLQTSVLTIKYLF